MRFAYSICLVLFGCGGGGGGDDDVGPTTAPTPTWVRSTNPSNRLDMAQGIAIDPGGVTVAGFDGLQGIRLDRIDRDGNDLWTFSETPGPGSTNFGGVSATADAIYTALGVSGAGSDRHWRAQRLGLVDHLPVWSKDTNPLVGTATDPIASTVSTNGLYVLGYTPSPTGPSQWHLDKQDLATGDITWAIDIDPDVMRQDRPAAIAAASDSVYLAGVHDMGSFSATNTAWRVERRDETNGGVRWSKVDDYNSTDDLPAAIAVSDAVYVAGSTGVVGTSHSIWRIEKRDLETGELVWSQASLDGGATAMAVSATGLVIVGAQVDPATGAQGWRIEKRRLDDGALVWAETEPLDFGSSAPLGIVVEDGDAYVAGWETPTLAGDDLGWRVERRPLD